MTRQPSFRGPWLGARRGALVDWTTQRWVEVTGRAVDLAETGWLDGPSGATDRIGADFFERHADERGPALDRGAGDSGLMTSFAALDGPAFDASRVQPQVADFYQRTSLYSLEVWSQWSGLFRPFGGLLAFFFSRRLEQLNVPLAPLDTSRGMTSRVVRLCDPSTGEVALTGWVRQNALSGHTVYVGAYSLTEVPGHAGPCVKVDFPLPNGHATVVLRPTVGTSGQLVLESSGRRFGDPGFYFVVRADRRRARARYLRTFQERIVVGTDRAGTLRTDHTFRIWGRVFLQLHYLLRAETSEDGGS